MNKYHKPYIIPGEIYRDERGEIISNNSFDLSEIKRFYEIRNTNTNYIRGWKGHHIESRWFTASYGKIKIIVSSIKKIIEDNPENLIFKLDSNTKDILYVPPGWATAIQQLNKNSKVIAFADSHLGDYDDDFRSEHKNLN